MWEPSAVHLGRYKLAAQQDQVKSSQTPPSTSSDCVSGRHLGYSREDTHSLWPQGLWRIGQRGTQLQVTTRTPGYPPGPGDVARLCTPRESRLE